MAKKLTEIDDLFSFAMLLVVFGHSMIFNNFSANADWYLFVRRIIYSFHMHFFFFISGFLFIYTNINKDNFSWFAIIQGKLKRLMLPYFFLLSLVYLPRVYMSKYTAGQFNLDFFSYVKMFINPHNSPMYNYWFIFTLFIFFLFNGIFIEIIKKKCVFLGLIITIFLFYLSIIKIDIHWFCINYIAGYMIYFWLGCLFYLVREKVNKLDSMLWATLLFFVIFAVTATHSNFDGVFKVFNTLIRLSGIFFAYFFILTYKRFGCKFILFQFMKGYTYPIYLLSWFFHEGVAFVINKQMGFGFYAVFPLSLSFALIFPVLMSKFIEKRLPRFKCVIGL